MLSPERKAAFQAILEIEKGELKSDEAVNKFIEKYSLIPPSSSLFTNIVYGTLKFRKTIDNILKDYIKFNETPIEILIILRMGVYQTIYLDKVPIYAIVHQSVQQSKDYDNENNKVSKFVNAVLRKIVSRKFKGFDKGLSDVLPNWIKKLYDDYTEDDSFIIFEDFLKPPSRVIRVNPLLMSVDECLKKLSKVFHNVSKGIFSPVSIILKDNFRLVKELLPQGSFFVQDEASQIIPYFVMPGRNERVLDICSAPGGKLTLLQGIAHNLAELFSIEVDDGRFLKLKDTVKEHKVKVKEFIKIDGTNYIKRFEGFFDKILLDPPCSGFGVINRNPELLWRIQKNDIVKFYMQQRALLGNAIRYLKKGGMLVYSTCTVTNEENEENIRWCTDNFPVVLIPLKEIVRDEIRAVETFVNKGYFLKTKPFKNNRDIYHLDCFFVSVIEKR